MKLSPKIFSFLKFLLFPAKSNNSQQQSVVLSQLQQENTINDFPEPKAQIPVSLSMTQITEPLRLLP